MYNVDLGYVSFKLAFSNYDLWEMKHGKDVAIASMDSRPFRKDIDPNYKSQRIYGKEEQIRIVSDLRKHILESSKLPLCKIEGNESDDILACWYIFNPQDKIIGLDKDFWQLGVKSLYTHDLTEYTFEGAVNNCSNFICELAEKNFALYQALVGDASDNIPRILAKGKEGKNQVNDILKVINTPAMGDLLYSVFEDKILTNLKLVLFPFYKFMNYSTEDNWYAPWVDGQYYNPAFWTDYYQLIQENLKPNTVTNSYSQMELFGLV